MDIAEHRAYVESTLARTREALQQWADVAAIYARRYAPDPEVPDDQVGPITNMLNAMDQQLRVKQKLYERMRTFPAAHPSDTRRQRWMLRRMLRKSAAAVIGDLRQAEARAAALQAERDR
jgi:hypothetical protein